MRQKQSAYTIVNLAAGVARDNWSLDLFIDNATDERAELVRYGVGYFDPFGAIVQDSEVSVNRPRSWGVRYSMRFQ